MKVNFHHHARVPGVESAADEAAVGNVDLPIRVETRIEVGRVLNQQQDLATKVSRFIPPMAPRST